MFYKIFPSTNGYTQLDKRCSREDNDAEGFQLHSQGCSNTKRIFFKIIVAFHVILLAAGAVLWYTWSQHSMNRSLKERSFYSPLLNRMEIPFVLRFDEPQTIMGGGGDMSWGSQPSPEIDKMWESISSEATVPVTEADIIALRKDPSVAVVLPEKYHFRNEKTYLGHAIIFHRIHCLNYLRKALYKDYYYPNGTESVPFHEQHIAHCIAMVLDHLTCAGDPGIYVYQWYEHTEVPMPDANTWSKCWDFGAFKRKFEQIALDFDPFSITKPAGVKAVEEHNNLQEIIYQTRNSDTHRQP